MSSTGWIYPTPPSSLPASLLAEIGQMTLAFALAETVVTKILADNGKGSVAKLSEKSIRKKLDLLLTVRPDLSEEIASMRASILARNTVVHGFTMGRSIPGESEPEYAAINFAYGGNSQSLSVPTATGLYRDAMNFVFVVLKMPISN